MALALPVMAVGSMALGAFSAIQSSQAQAANLQAEANAQKYNQELYNQQAQQAMAQATINSNANYRKAQEQIGTQRAQTAEAGIGFQGTGGDLIDQSAVNAEFDRQNQLYSGLLQSQSYTAQGQQAGYAADIANSQIGPTTTGGYLNAAGNILSGAANYSQNRSRANYASRGYF